MKKLLIASLGVLLSTPLLAEEVLYCIETKGYGIENWYGEPELYTSEGETFTIKIHNNFESIITKANDKYFTYPCAKETFVEHFHICDQVIQNKVTGNSIRYNSQTNHYVRVYSSWKGYLFDKSYKMHDIITVGKCEKF